MINHKLSVLKNNITNSLTAEYSLVIICSSSNEEKSQIISKLHLYRRPYGVSTNPAEYRKYLETHFIDKEQPNYKQCQTMIKSSFPASVVDLKG